MAQDKGVKEAVAKEDAKDCVRVLKVGWDETTVRMFCDLEKARRAFPQLNYSEDDVHKSIKYGVWASTDTGNRRLDAAYRESCNRGPIYLFFSVNASGQFSGLAQMESALDYTKKFGSWGQDKWNGTFQVRASIALHSKQHTQPLRREGQPKHSMLRRQHTPRQGFRSCRAMLRARHRRHRPTSSKHNRWVRRCVFVCVVSCQ